MPAIEEFRQWALGYSGCDGGDLGSPASPSIWLCGIEWGGGHGEDGLRQHMKEDVNTPPAGYDGWEENVSYPFNRNAMKLLGAIQGYTVDAYEEFARVHRPFVSGSSGYFKLNLFPIGFKNTDPQCWERGLGELTGFESKDEYVSWCVENRFERIKQWTQESRPEIVVCLGKTYDSDFADAFAVDPGEWVPETIDERDLRWAQNEFGSLVVLVPFMVNANGLIKNASIQKFGARIAEIRQSFAQSSTN